jgi:hypothetical protein
MELEELTEAVPQHDVWPAEEDAEDPAPVWVDAYEF